ncbi:class I adenylate-forming enzyme family protein [Verrucomicrobiaceae bacterium 227]
MNIVREIRQQHSDDLLAVISKDGDVSFGALFEAVDQVANYLKEHPEFQIDGIPRIGVRFPNGLAYIVVALAVLQTGACFVPIPDELTESERERLMIDTALHAVVSASGPGHPLPLNLGQATLTTRPSVTPQFPVDQFEALHPAFIRFSSGTTGNAKGVVLSHQSLFDRIHAANRGLQLQAGDRVLWTLPMAHHFAVTIVLYLYFGVTTVLEESHQPAQIYQAALKHKAHLLYGSPFHFAQLAQCQTAGPLPDLRMAISTASALKKEVAQSFETRFKLPLTQALGIIEVGLPILNRDHPSEKPEALGQALPDYEVNLKEGELFLKGPGMFDAYLLPWRRREDDWFATGDLVKKEGQTLTLQGRSKSVINVAGMKVFPEEIEAVLNGHPAIKESRVSAHEHPTLGAFPAAEVVLKEGTLLPPAREMRDYCGKFLAAYKLPMQISRVESLPRTASGKIRRYQSS